MFNNLKSKIKFRLLLKRIMCFVFGLCFGVFMFIFGGYDDSPGAQGLGVLFFVGGVVGLLKSKE